MNLGKQAKRSIKFPLMVGALTLAIGASLSYGGPFHGHGGHGMFSPLEKLVHHIDLTEYQEEAIEKILTDLKGQKEHKKRFEMMKGFMLMNPDDPDYQIKVDEKANVVAQEVKHKIIQMNTARKAIYDLLDPQQKEELNKVLHKKVQEMEKRIARHED